VGGHTSQIRPTHPHHCILVYLQVVTPIHDYRDKYRHLIGSSSGQEAAIIAQPNKSFGYGELYLKLVLLSLLLHLVPSANKRDTRSIEETLNDLRTKKAKVSDHDVK